MFARYPITLHGSPLGIAWGMVYGTPFGPNAHFMPQLRSLGAGFTKVTLFWSQIEPKEGTFLWEAFDAFVEQLASPEEAILVLYSSSPWGTRTSSWAFPPSPAKDPAAYARFVRAVVERARGRIRYFQNDSEPNNPFFWAGSADEFAAQFKVFGQTVREADPAAQVVLGGYDGLFDPSPLHAIPRQEVGLAFFDRVLAAVDGQFDLFDLHLYADPYTIPARMDYFRRKLAAAGCPRPIIATEAHGPGFFEFAANRRHFGLMAMPPAEAEAAIAGFYAQAESLPEATRMYLQGRTPELEQKFLRLQTRDLIVRTVLALSAGVQKIAYWDLCQGNSKRDEVKTLMHGKHKLMEYRDGALTQFTALAGSYRELAEKLAGVAAVVRLATSDPESEFCFRIDRAGGSPGSVSWDRRRSEELPVFATCP